MTCDELMDSDSPDSGVQVGRLFKNEVLTTGLSEKKPLKHHDTTVDSAKTYYCNKCDFG